MKEWVKMMENVVFEGEKFWMPFLVFIHIYAFLLAVCGCVCVYVCMCVCVLHIVLIVVYPFGLGLALAVKNALIGNAAVAVGRGMVDVQHVVNQPCTIIQI